MRTYINDIETEVTLKKGNFSFNNRALRQAVKDAGIEWKQAKIFVAHFPEQGRYLEKAPGFEQIGAGG